MEPFPGPGQCSLPSSPGSAWAGQEDADSWELGGLVTGSPEPSTSSRPPPRVCAHRPVCTCRGIHTVRRCGSKCLCQGYDRLCARVSTENALENRGSRAQASPSPPAPCSRAWGWQSRTGQGAPQPPPSLGQCQLELSIEDSTIATSGHPKGCQWVSVPFALRGGADKQGTISSSKRPQKQRDWMKQAVQSPWGVQKPLLNLEGVFLGRGAPLICGFHP